MLSAFVVSSLVAFTWKIEVQDLKTQEVKSYKTHEIFSLPFGKEETCYFQPGDTQTTNSGDRLQWMYVQCVRVLFDKPIAAFMAQSPACSNYRPSEHDGKLVSKVFHYDFAGEKTGEHMITVTCEN